MVYNVKRAPKVYLISPKLIQKNGELVPHLYDQETQRLCLFMPKYEEWKPFMYISETIIPWASEWLVFYELWLSTGEWLGGGEHLSLNDLSP